jgi:hypothetical protein
MVFVQASTEKMPSVLQAESTALLLAASVDNALNLQEVTFLTDNSTLAAAVASTDAPHSCRFLGRFGNTLLIISRSHILSIQQFFMLRGISMELLTTVHIRRLDRMCLALSSLALIQLIETDFVEFTFHYFVFIFGVF